MEVVLKSPDAKAVKAANPRAWYFCDPVMGAASGCKVEPGIQEFLVRTMPEMADAMYVDKRLDGIAAVQTLSRLNRIAPARRADRLRSVRRALFVGREIFPGPPRFSPPASAAFQS